MEFSRIRGTVDLFDKKINKFNIVLDHIKTIAQLFNFKEINTPIFEQSNLYTKAIGDSSDIVHKEFYSFVDKGGRSIALRPEGTAGVIRAVVENKMLLSTNYLLKLFYYGPMFRYERPQSGRQRQFNQFGVEIIGDFTIYDEVNLINFADSILNNFNISKYELRINNIGSCESRKKWIEELKKYFSNYTNELSQDSLERLKVNPLRILDDKVDGSKPFVKNAPKLVNFLSDDEKEYFKQITKILDELNISYIIDENLVRGLDYYTGLVFEFVSTNDVLKGQSTIIGGGKYSSLVKDTGGPDKNGIGLGIGLERLIIAIDDESPELINLDDSLDIVFAPICTKAQLTCMVLSNMMRFNGYSCDVLFNVNDLKKQFKFSAFNNAKYVVIIGDNELKKETVIVKDQSNLEQSEVKINNLVDFFKNKIKGDFNDK